MTAEKNRPLTDVELDLVRWMLEHGTAEAKPYLDQVEFAEVISWRCSCGCASIMFQIKGHPEPPPGIFVLGDFLMGEGDHLSGAFIYSSAGLLRGIEINGLAGEAPRRLPNPGDLRVFEP